MNTFQQLFCNQKNFFDDSKLIQPRLSSSQLRFSLFEPVRPLKKTRLGTQLTRFPSRKMGRFIRCESSLETAFTLHAEWSKEVIKIVEQPLTVTIYVDGKQYDYVPDFATLDASHSIVIWEVKPPHWDQSPRLVRKYCSAKIELAKQGLNFELVTIDKLCSTQLLRNLRFFYPQISNVPSAEVLRVVDALRCCGGVATVAEILRQEPTCSFSAICALAWELWNDIHLELFTAQSLLSLGAQQ